MLGVRYRMVHIIAVSVCLMGVGCLVWANIEDTKIDGTDFFLLPYKMSLLVLYIFIQNTIYFIKLM